MKFLVRRVKREDAASISKIRVESWQITYRGIFPDSFLNSMNWEKEISHIEKWVMADDSFCFVAEIDEDVVGFVIAGRCREKNAPADGEIWALYLDRDYHGRGIGKALLLAGKAALKESGFSKMLISVLEQNDSSLAFYKGMGGERGRNDCFVLQGTTHPTASFYWDL